MSDDGTCATFLGEAHLQFIHRLGDSASDLATYLEIPVHAQRRFAPGEQADGIWTWLDARDQLERLPDALRAIGRGDLAEILEAKRHLRYARPDA